MSKGKSLAELVDNLKKEFDLRSLSASESDGVLKLHNIEVQKDSRGSGVGSKVMGRLTDYADRNNLQMTLTPDVKNTERGTTSAGRLVKFYKKFDFIENKGKNKDFSLSDSMYRAPKKIALLAAVGASGSSNALSPQQTLEGAMNPLAPPIPSQVLSQQNAAVIGPPKSQALYNAAQIAQDVQDWRQKNLPAPVNWLLPDPDPEYMRNRAYGREPTMLDKIKFGLSFL